MGTVYLIIHKLVIALLSVVMKFMKTPSQVLFSGKNSSADLAKHIMRLGHKRVLLVTEKVLVDLGMAEPRREVIAGAGGGCRVLGGMFSYPTNACG